MTELEPPDAALFASWRAAVDDFGAETIHGGGFWHLDDAARRSLDEAGFAALVRDLRREGDETVPVPDDPVSGRRKVHCTYLWITDPPGEVVGFLALRHSIDTPFLREEGGHIGYSVRPGRRRQGHAGRALALGVRRAADRGIDRVLVTCDEHNLASARTIEVNGGEYEGSRHDKRRYWIDTAAPPRVG